MGGEREGKEGEAREREKEQKKEKTVINTRFEQKQFRR